MDSPELPPISIPDKHNINISTELYKTFYYVAKEESISKAAEKLYITQPAVSRAIRQLEENMECMLFFRTAKGVTLTNEGKILFAFVEQAFNFLYLGEKKLSQMKNLESGEISIGVGDSICKHYLIPYLKRYNTEYPGINIHITNQKTYEIINMLKNGKIDLGIINLPIEDDQLRITKVMDIHDCFVVGQKYKNLASKSISIKELINYPTLLLEKGSNSRKFIEQFFIEHGISITPDFELGNFELLAQFAMINLGIACIVREFFPQELETNQLFEIPIKEKIPPRGIGIISLKIVPLSTSAKELIYMLTNKK